MSVSSLNSIGQTVFEFFRKRKCGRTDGWTDKRTNEQMELHQFQKEPSYDAYLSPCQVRIRLDKPFSS